MQKQCPSAQKQQENPTRIPSSRTYHACTQYSKNYHETLTL